MGAQSSVDIARNQVMLLAAAGLGKDLTADVFVANRAAFFKFDVFSKAEVLQLDLHKD